jgi:hypothetical protein
VRQTFKEFISLLETVLENAGTFEKEKVENFTYLNSFLNVF